MLKNIKNFPKAIKISFMWDRCTNLASKECYKEAYSELIKLKQYAAKVNYRDYKISLFQSFLEVKLQKYLDAIKSLDESISILETKKFKNKYDLKYLKKYICVLYIESMDALPGVSDSPIVKQYLVPEDNKPLDTSNVSNHLIRYFYLIEK